MITAACFITAKEMIEGLIVLVVIMLPIILIRLQPLKCPKCGHFMNKTDSGCWYCYGCKRFYSSSDIYKIKKRHVEAFKRRKS